MEARQPVYEVEDDDDEPITVKNEEDGDETITFEPIYFEEGADELDPTLLHDDYQMEVVVDDSNEHFSESSPMQTTTKKDLKATLNSSFKETIVKQENRNFMIVELENNKRAFQCDICSKTFKDRSKLKSHREIHTTERNVICKVIFKYVNLKYDFTLNFLQECGKSFKTMNCLRNHKRMHLPVRTYFGCDRCDKKYTQKIQLKKHIEIVHMNRRGMLSYDEQR